MVIIGRQYQELSIIFHRTIQGYENEVINIFKCATHDREAYVEQPNTF